MVSTWSPERDEITVRKDYAERPNYSKKEGCRFGADLPAIPKKKKTGKNLAACPTCTRLAAIGFGCGGRI